MSTDSVTRLGSGGPRPQLLLGMLLTLGLGCTPRAPLHSEPPAPAPAPPPASQQPQHFLTGKVLGPGGEPIARQGDLPGAHADFEAGLASFREGDPPQLLDSLRQGLQTTSTEK